jgi:amino acid permease
MTVIASSRLLGQMSKDGYCRLRLDRENRFGRPWRALSFDCLANVALLSVLAIVNLGSLASIPTALLAMANTGYFIAIIIGLLACAVAARSRAAGRRTVVVSIALVTVNGIIFSAAGFVWGWPNLAIGFVCVVAAVGVLAPARSLVLAHGARARVGEVTAL